MLHLVPAQQRQDFGLAERFRQITGETAWKPAGTIPIPFDTFHPQGMTFASGNIFFSSVEVTVRPERTEQPDDRYDRTPGEGVGHLFKIDRDGNLLASITLGEGSMYHPGGIDFDGTYIWVPVAEYRPNSRSIVYRVDPNNMQATEVFRFDDHLGALVFDPANSTLHGVSWGSRFLYSWRLNENSQLPTEELDPAERREPNSSFYVDYQDCMYADVHHMLCAGIKTHDVSAVGDAGSLSFTLGGLELVDLESKRAVHQLPFNWIADNGTVMTQNPFFVEQRDDRLRFYFMPEDNESTIYMFDAFWE